MSDFVYKRSFRQEPQGALNYYAEQAEKKGYEPSKKNWEELEKDEEVFDRKYE